MSWSPSIQQGVLGCPETDGLDRPHKQQQPKKQVNHEELQQPRIRSVLRLCPRGSRWDGVRTHLLTCPVVGAGRRGRRRPGEGRGGAGTEGGGGFRGVTFGSKPVLTNWEGQELNVHFMSLATGWCHVTLPGTKSSCNWGLRRQWWGGGKGDEDASRGFDVFEVDDVMSAGGGALQTQYKV